MLPLCYLGTANQPHLAQYGEHHPLWFLVQFSYLVGLAEIRKPQVLHTVLVPSRCQNRMTHHDPG